MKTFKDLEFKQHPNIQRGRQAKMYFSNGYGVSVVSGDFFYTSEDKPYEMAILKDDTICYDTPIADDVLGYLTAKDITKYMLEIQRLKCLSIY